MGKGKKRVVLLNDFGSVNVLRKYLGDLIHALRSHNPCTNLHRSDPLYCDKVPCIRLADQWCHMHNNFSDEGDCSELQCLRSRFVIHHWMYCIRKNCYLCGPWIRPSMLEKQPKQFLDDIFGSKDHKFSTFIATLNSLGKVLEQTVWIVSGEVPDAEEDSEDVSSVTVETGDDLEDLDFEENPVFAVSGKLAGRRDVLPSCPVCTDKPGPSGYDGPYIRPIFLDDFCALECETV